MVYDAIPVDLQVHWSRLDILALPNSGQFSAKNRLIVGTSRKKNIKWRFAGNYFRWVFLALRY